MDFGTIITRAIKVTWKHKVLWVLGFLVALGSGSSGGFGNSGGSPTTSYRMQERDLPWMQDFFSDPSRIAIILAVIALLLCILFILSIIFWIVSLIARGGLIAGVEQIETTGNTTFRAAWSVGANRFWRVLGLNVLISIPIIIAIVLVVVLVGGAIAALVIGIEGAHGSRNMAPVGGVFAILTMLCCMICVMVIVSTIKSALEVFGERAIVLENLGVVKSISRAWQVFRSNLGNIILIALVMLVIGFMFGILSMAAIGVILLPTLLPVFGELMRGDTVSGGAAAVAMIGAVVAMIFGMIINTLFITFNSTTWTIAYRQFIAAPVVPASPAIQPPAPVV